MHETKQMWKLRRSLDTIKNASMNLASDIASGDRLRVISDFSILFGTIYPHKAFDPRGVIISPSMASSCTISIYNEQGVDAPIELIVPPATVVEILHSLHHEAAKFRRVGESREAVTEYGKMRNKLGDMSSHEISKLLRKIPNNIHKGGLENLTNIFASPHMKSCSEAFGKEKTIEAHRISKALRKRLISTFDEHRDRDRDIAPLDRHIRDWADADNIALAPTLDGLSDEGISERVLYGGPIPIPNRIVSDDRYSIMEHQRNFIYPFLGVTLKKNNFEEKQFGVEKAMNMSANELVQDCARAMENLDISMEMGYNDLIPAQKRSILRVFSTIKYLRSLEGESKEEMNKKRESLSEQLKQVDSIRDKFIEHSEAITSVSDMLLDSLPELNDDEMLDEFSLTELKDAGKAPWLGR